MFIKTETGQQQAWILCCSRDPCQYARFQWRQFGFACCNVVKPRPRLPALRWLPGQSFHREKVQISHALIAAMRMTVLQ